MWLYNNIICMFHRFDSPWDFLFDALTFIVPFQVTRSWRWTVTACMACRTERPWWCSSRWGQVRSACTSPAGSRADGGKGCGCRRGQVILAELIAIHLLNPIRLFLLKVLRFFHEHKCILSKGMSVNLCVRCKYRGLHILPPTLFPSG